MRHDEKSVCESLGATEMQGGCQTTGSRCLSASPWRMCGHAFGSKTRSLKENEEDSGGKKMAV